MSLLSKLCEDLKKEVWRYLHKKYYDVVLDELSLMTFVIRSTLDLYWLSYSKITTGKRYAYQGWTDEVFIVARWVIYNWSSGNTIQEIREQAAEIDLF